MAKLLVLTAPVWTVITLTPKGAISKRKASVMAVSAALEPALMPVEGFIIQHIFAVLGVASFCVGGDNQLTHPWCVDARGYGADVHDGAFGGDDEVGEGLCHAECAPDVDVVHLFRRFDVEVKGWHDEGLAGVVDQVV